MRKSLTVTIIALTLWAVPIGSAVAAGAGVTTHAPDGIRKLMFPHGKRGMCRDGGSAACGGHAGATAWPGYARARRKPTPHLH